MTEMGGAGGDRMPRRTGFPLPVRYVNDVLRGARVRRMLRRSATLPAAPGTSRREAPARPPVFVLTAGWRSGSTAVQRLVVSGGTAFVWGEPFATSRMLARTEQLARESSSRDAADDRVVPTDQLGVRLASAWLATTNPDPGYLLLGIRELFTTTFWTPLAGTGFQTWGTKEVALTARQVAFLVELFPDASFVCVVRDPRDAYRSFRRSVLSGISPSASSDGPLRYARGPAAFGQVWAEMASSFRSFESRPGFHVFRYEDITGSPAFPDELGSRLDMKLDASVWKIRLGGTPRVEDNPMTSVERRLLDRVTAAEAARWGY